MKNITKIRCFLLFACIVTLVLVTFVNANEEEIPYSEAQLLLFKRAHLSNVLQPASLLYSFEQTGEQKFTDSVAARITHTYEDGTRDLQFDFLTGDRNELYPDITGFRGNPIIMLFLEWDAVKMENTAGSLASQNYFRNKMRIGFWKYCEVDEVNVAYGDAQYKGKRITMQPFANNEADRKKAAIFADKQYEFILVDEIPGELYQISTKMPSNENEAIESTQMTFHQLESL